MNLFLSSRLIQKGGRSLGSVVCSAILSVQHLLMKAAIAFSLKLCLYTAQVLLNASTNKERPRSSAVGDAL